LSIGGIIPVSFVDYPEQIATTIFISGCNFRCGYCHNPDLVFGKTKTTTEAEVFEYLFKARGRWIDAVCISGGEPTQYLGLKQFIHKIKKMGLLVKLDTNGTHPEILYDLDIDYLAMDFKTSLGRYCELTGVKNIEEKISSSLDYILNQNNFDYEIRTTLVPSLVGPKEISEMSQMLKGVKKWILQPFRNIKTIDPNFKKIIPFDKATCEKILKTAQEKIPHTSLRN